MNTLQQVSYTIDERQYHQRTRAAFLKPRTIHGRFFFFSRNNCKFPHVKLYLAHLGFRIKNFFLLWIDKKCRTHVGKEEWPGMGSYKAKDPWIKDISISCCLQRGKLLTQQGEPNRLFMNTGLDSVSRKGFARIASRTRFHDYVTEYFKNPDDIMSL